MLAIDLPHFSWVQRANTLDAMNLSRKTIEMVIVKSIETGAITENTRKLYMQS